MVIGEDGCINFEGSILETVSMEYNIILQNTPRIFSNLHKLGC
jgi:hypothetical protein